MKKRIFYLLLMLPFCALAQFDFDTRYFTIDDTSLPEAPQFDESSIKLISDVEEVNPGSFTLERTPTFAGTLNSFKISSTNYWLPVDMRGVVSETESYIVPFVDVAPLQAKAYGASIYSTDGSTKVTNTVYKEMRGLDLLDPCPPFGICPRCAPYRLQRGY